MTDSIPVILWIDDDREQLRLYQNCCRAQAIVSSRQLMHHGALICSDAITSISDQKLRDCAGADVLAEMRRLRPKAPVILFSGSSLPTKGIEFADLLLAKGADNIRELIAAIAKLLTKEQTA